MTIEDLKAEGYAVQYFKDIGWLIATPKATRQNIDVSQWFGKNQGYSTEAEAWREVLRIYEKG